MEFRAATDRLADCATHAEVAQELGVSVQSIRQARLDPSSPSFRGPPVGWRRALARIARRRGDQLLKLAEEFEAEE